MQERIRYYEDIRVTTEILDNILTGTVINTINIGLQQIGLGLDTPQGVANKTQRAFDRDQ